jgi:hypothetical protein
MWPRRWASSAAPKAAHSSQANATASAVGADVADVGAVAGVVAVVAAGISTAIVLAAAVQRPARATWTETASRVTSPRTAMASIAAHTTMTRMITARVTTGHTIRARMSRERASTPPRIAAHSGRARAAARAPASRDRRPRADPRKGAPSTSRGARNRPSANRADRTTHVPRLANRVRPLHRVVRISNPRLALKARALSPRGRTWCGPPRPLIAARAADARNSRASTQEARVCGLLQAARVPFLR